MSHFDRERIPERVVHARDVSGLTMTHCVPNERDTQASEAVPA